MRESSAPSPWLWGKRTRVYRSVLSHVVTALCVCGSIPVVRHLLGLFDVAGRTGRGGESALWSLMAHSVLGVSLASQAASFLLSVTPTVLPTRTPPLLAFFHTYLRGNYSNAQPGFNHPSPQDAGYSRRPHILLGYLLAWASAFFLLMTFNSMANPASCFVSLDGTFLSSIWISLILGVGFVVRRIATSDMCLSFPPIQFSRFHRIRRRLGPMSRDAMMFALWSTALTAIFGYLTCSDDIKSWVGFLAHDLQAAFFVHMAISTAFVVREVIMTERVDFEQELAGNQPLWLQSFENSDLYVEHLRLMFLAETVERNADFRHLLFTSRKGELWEKLSGQCKKWVDIFRERVEKEVTRLQPSDEGSRPAVAKHRVQTPGRIIADDILEVTKDLHKNIKRASDLVTTPPERWYHSVTNVIQALKNLPKNTWLFLTTSKKRRDVLYDIKSWWRLQVEPPQTPTNFNVVFRHHHLALNAAKFLSCMLATSVKEDTTGAVFRSVEHYLGCLVDLEIATEALDVATSTNRQTAKWAPADEPLPSLLQRTPHAVRVLKEIRTCIYHVSINYHQSFGKFQFTQAQVNKLEQFLRFAQ